MQTTSKPSMCVATYVEDESCLQMLRRRTARAARAGFERVVAGALSFRKIMEDAFLATIGSALLLYASMFAVAQTSGAFAHEHWILTPEQIAALNAMPKPGLFSHISTYNVVTITLFVIFVIWAVRLWFGVAHELLPGLKLRLSSYGGLVSPILRFCVAWALLSSAFGAEPRFGVEPFASPTLFAADLELQRAGSEWLWLRWAEVVIAVALLLGVYVQLFAGLLILLAMLGAWLFGEDILAYAGALIGVAIYLLTQGPGRFHPPLPTPGFLVPVQTWLESTPRLRAQAIMRILTGLTLLYCGVWFKALHPNLLLGIITAYKLPILSSAPEFFTLLIAMIEISVGILLATGIYLRTLSVVLLAAFFFFASLLPESMTAHIMFYGVMLSFIFNGAGEWAATEDWATERVRYALRPAPARRPGERDLFDFALRPGYRLRLCLEAVGGENEVCGGPKNGRGWRPAEGMANAFDAAAAFVSHRLIEPIKPLVHFLGAGAGREEVLIIGNEIQGRVISAEVRAWRPAMRNYLFLVETTAKGLVLCQLVLLAFWLHRQYMGP